MLTRMIDANTDGLFVMLDWAKAHDLVDRECLEKVLFHTGCKGIGVQKLMSTVKGFTLRVIDDSKCQSHSAENK